MLMKQKYPKHKQRSLSLKNSQVICQGVRKISIIYWPWLPLSYLFALCWWLLKSHQALTGMHTWNKYESIYCTCISKNFVHSSSFALILKGFTSMARADRLLKHSWRHGCIGLSCRTCLDLFNSLLFNGLGPKYWNNDTIKSILFNFISLFHDCYLNLVPIFIIIIMITFISLSLNRNSKATKIVQFVHSTRY